MDNNQFAQAVKQKYPQYANIPNDQLTQAVVKKYPQYQKFMSGAGPLTSRSQTPFNGMDQQKLMSLYAQMNPKGAQNLIGNMLQQRLSAQTMNPLQQSEIAKNQAETQNYLNKPQEMKVALEEKKAEADANRQIRRMQAEMNMLLAQGRHDEAEAKIEEMKASLKQRAADAQAARRLKAQSENAKYPIQNFYRSVTGKRPLIDVPGDQDLSTMSDDELRKIANGK